MPKELTGDLTVSNAAPMNNREIETMIQDAERLAGNSAFIGARLMGIGSLLVTPFVFLSELGSLFACLFGVCGFVTAYLWREGKKFHRELMNERARTLWQKLDYIGVSGEQPSLKERELLKAIARVYDHDPQGELFPLPQAIRLVLAWKQQQARLHVIGAHIHQMHIARSTLLEKQKLLRELGDENAGIEAALTRLDAEISVLEPNHNTLRASCARLEALVVQVDATVRRRELHREVGELTAHLAIPQLQETGAFELRDEHLDIERQIGREIETYLQLERETEAQMRDL